MEQELVFDMILEAHDYVIPDSFKSVLRFAHFFHNTSIDMGVEMPALNIGHVSSFDWHCEKHWNYLPALVIGWVSQVLLGVQRWQDTLMVNDI